MTRPQKAHETKSLREGRKRDKRAAKMAKKAPPPPPPSRDPPPGPVSA